MSETTEPNGRQMLQQRRMEENQTAYAINLCIRMLTRIFTIVFTHLSLWQGDSLLLDLFSALLRGRLKAITNYGDAVLEIIK